MQVQLPSENLNEYEHKEEIAARTLHYRGRFPFNAGIKTTKYPRAEGVNHVEHECSFCVDGRAKAMIQKAAKPLTVSDAGQFLCLHLFIPLFFLFSLIL